MVIFAIITVVFLVFAYLSCKRGSKTNFYFDATHWFAGFFCFGCAGLALGIIVSLGVGNFIIPKNIILTERHVLEPVVVQGREVFVIKDKQSPFFSYTYFTKDGGKDGDCVLKINSVLLEEEEKNINFIGDNKRRLDKYKKTPKGILGWFFFSSGRVENKLFLFEKNDIL